MLRTSKVVERWRTEAVSADAEAKLLARAGSPPRAPMTEEERAARRARLEARLAVE